MAHFKTLAAHADTKKVQRYHRLVVQWEARASTRHQNAQITLERAKDALLKAEQHRVRLAKAAEKVRMTHLLKI